VLHEPHELKRVKGAGAGTTGAHKVQLAFPAQNVVVPFKWKTMDGGWKPFWGRLDGVNNSPRKEIAVWKLQKLFLDPEDYVVPPSFAYCAALTNYFDPSAMATRDGSECVLGVLSLWLKGLELPDPLLDKERFGRDYAYAYYLSNLNLLTYLAEHHDGRLGNFLVWEDDARRQAFAIDNGVAFGDGFSGLWYNWFVRNWDKLRVPALRKESIDRLRKVREEDLEKLLGVVAQLELDDDGIFVNVPLGENLDPDDGVRIEGNVIQFGLNEDEIEDLWERIEDVDEGDVAVF